MISLKSLRKIHFALELSLWISIGFCRCGSSLVTRLSDGERTYSPANSTGQMSDQTLISDGISGRWWEVMVSTSLGQLLVGDYVPAGIPGRWIGVKIFKLVISWCQVSAGNRQWSGSADNAEWVVRRKKSNSASCWTSLLFARTTLPHKNTDLN